MVVTQSSDLAATFQYNGTRPEPENMEYDSIMRNTIDTKNKTEFLNYILSKVQAEPMSGCWIWTAAWDGGGYPHFRLSGKDFKAHRVSYELHKGPIPRNYDVCHSCDLPCYINPNHLFVGTRRQNMLDSSNKGRFVTSKRKAHLNKIRKYKLSELDVAEIHRLRLIEKSPTKFIAAKFKINFSTVNR